VFIIIFIILLELSVIVKVSVIYEYLVTSVILATEFLGSAGIPRIYRRG